MTYLEACELTAIYKGIWDAETLYEYRDIVKCEDDYYFALGSSLNQNPASSDDYWELIEQDAEVAGRVASIPKGEWDSETEYKLLDLVTHNDKSYIARKNSTNHEPGDETDEYWMLLVEPYLVDMEGATGDSDGTHGLAPEPSAGDEDKVLTADGQWRRTLQTSIVNNNNHDEDTGDEDDPAVFGYNDTEGNFLPFITYEEAVESSMIGTAQPENVLIGTTFSNISERGLSGTMRDFSQATQLVVTTDQYDPDRPIIQQTKVNDVGYYEVSVPTGYWERSLGNSSILIPCEEKSISINGTTATITPSAGKVLSKVTCVSAATPTQTKTVTAGTSNLTVKPDSGKLLSQVTVKPTPTQSKTVTASRSAQTVKPDSGKYLSQVVINKFPDATGTFKCGSNNGASANNDMGTSNNYRYIDATNVYKLGKSEALGNLTDVTSKYTFQCDGNFKWGQYIGVPVGYYIMQYIATAVTPGKFVLPTNSSLVKRFYEKSTKVFQWSSTNVQTHYAYIALIKTTNTTLRWEEHRVVKGMRFDASFKMYTVT